MAVGNTEGEEGEDRRRQLTIQVHGDSQVRMVLWGGAAAAAAATTTTTTTTTITAPLKT